MMSDEFDKVLANYDQKMEGLDLQMQLEVMFALFFRAIELCKIHGAV